MAVERAIKRLRPQDRELSQIQDNLGNALDGVLQTITQGGLRRTLQMGTYWTYNNGMPTTDTPMQRAITNLSGGMFQTMSAFEVMPTAGSVLSLQAGANGAPSGRWFVTLYLDGKATVLQATGTAARLYATIPQGRIKYAAGSALAVFIRGDASINQSFSASVDVESQA